METAASAPDDVDQTAVAELSDPELISRVRDGDVDAYGSLFSRHVDAATRLARTIAGHGDADDLVSDAFVKVLNVLLGGGGPDVAFRAYLLTAVRRLHVDRIRSTQRLNPVDDLTPYDPGVPFTDTAVAGFEGGAAARAFASLPERWQMVLWHLEVENQKPADIAPLLGMSANSVSALAYRAREGLRQAFLTMHAGDLADEHCRETNDLLGGYVRGALSKRDTAKVNDHLVHCRRCTAVYLELADVNSSLAAVLGPALLGTAAAAYVGATAGGTAGGGLGVVALLDRAKDFVAANAAATTAGAAAVGVAATTAILVATHQGAPERPSAAADPPGGSLLPSAQAPKEPGKGTGRTHSTTSDAPATKRRVGAQAPHTDTPASSGGGPVSPPGAATDTTVADRTSATPEDQPPSSSQAHQEAAPAAPAPQKPPTSEPPPRSDPPPQKPPPSKEPPDKEPSATRVLDLHVTAQPLAPVHGRVTVTVLALGLTNGPQGSLVATADTGSFQQVGGPACARIPHGFSCPVNGPAVLFRFSNTTASGPTLTFKVTPPSGYDDPNPGNNTTSVHLPRR